MFFIKFCRLVKGMYVLLSYKSFVDVGCGIEFLGLELREDFIYVVVGGDFFDGYQVCCCLVVVVLQISMGV